MTFISEEVIDKMWKAVSSMSEREILSLQKRHLKNQKAITQFVIRQLDEFPEEPASVLLWVTHVILEAAEKQLPKPKKVSAPSIKNALEVVQAPDFESPEPHLVQYAFEAFDEGDVEIGEDVQQAFLLIVNAIVLCLHNALKK